MIAAPRALLLAACGLALAGLSCAKAEPDAAGAEPSAYKGAPAEPGYEMDELADEERAAQAEARAGAPAGPPAAPAAMPSADLATGSTATLKAEDVGEAMAGDGLVVGLGAGGQGAGALSGLVGGKGGRGPANGEGWAGDLPAQPGAPPAVLDSKLDRLAMDDAEAFQAGAREPKPAPPSGEDGRFARPPEPMEQALEPKDKEKQAKKEAPARRRQLASRERADNEAEALGGEEPEPEAAAEGEEDADEAAWRSRDGGAVLPPEEPPTTFLPRVAYFENTYLGGNAAHQERVRRLAEDHVGSVRPWEDARAAPQPFDAPEDGAIAVTATLDRSWIDGPGRVFLQVGLQGSRRFGWRRPPLDLVLVVDGPLAAASDAGVTELVAALLRQLGPQDRLGVVIAWGRPEAVAEPGPVKRLRTALADGLGRGTRPGGERPDALADGIALAGELLREAAQDEARVPGSQVVLVATGGPRPDAPARARAAARAAHALTLQGAVTSVVEVAPSSQGVWWEVAAGGHGNYHQVAGLAAAQAEGVVSEELGLLARVVARLLRLNVRLSPEARAVRVLGSRVLGAEEVARVKAREVATDQQLSRTLGVKADRGEDDDGLQTVIPYFHGGDAHVILIELWVDGPGAVADVTLRYKDMVELGNATARTSVALAPTPREATPAQALVRRNVQGFRLAEALERCAAVAAAQGPGAALGALDAARRLAVSREDRAMVDGFRRLLVGAQGGAGDGDVAEALAVAAERRIGLPAP